MFRGFYLPSLHSVSLCAIEQGYNSFKCNFVVFIQREKYEPYYDRAFQSISKKSIDRSTVSQSDYFCLLPHYFLQNFTSVIEPKGHKVGPVMEKPSFAVGLALHG